MAVTDSLDFLDSLWALIEEEEDSIDPVDIVSAMFSVVFGYMASTGGFTDEHDCQSFFDGMVTVYQKIADDIDAESPDTETQPNESLH